MVTKLWWFCWIGGFCLFVELHWEWSPPAHQAFFLSHTMVHLSIFQVVWDWPIVMLRSSRHEGKISNRLSNLTSNTRKTIIYYIFLEVPQSWKVPLHWDPFSAFTTSGGIARNLHRMSTKVFPNSAGLPPFVLPFPCYLLEAPNVMMRLLPPNVLFYFAIDFKTSF